MLLHVFTLVLAIQRLIAAPILIADNCIPPLEVTTAAPTAEPVVILPTDPVAALSGNPSTDPAVASAAGLSIGPSLARSANPSAAPSVALSTNPSAGPSTDPLVSEHQHTDAIGQILRDDQAPRASEQPAVPALPPLNPMAALVDLSPPLVVATPDPLNLPAASELPMVADAASTPAAASSAAPELETTTEFLIEVTARTTGEEIPPVLVAGVISKRQVDETDAPVANSSVGSILLPAAADRLTFSDFKQLEEKQETLEDQKKPKPSFDRLSKMRGTSGFDDNLFDDVPYVK
ncbi:hypothetical protein M3Y99_00919600 [Aphelenchoides fujianensis]|nr:hypothetical protein M3Y99_00919600 [Aphelenchoides fujianensis]